MGKRFEKINSGKAILEFYYWEGKPYNSKTITIYQLSKDDGIGLQRLTFWNNDINCPIITSNDGSLKHISNSHVISFNDGLSFTDFVEWFKNYDLSEPIAIIHFTSFRY